MAFVLQIKRFAFEADIPSTGLHPGEFLMSLDSRKLYLCWTDTVKIHIGSGASAYLYIAYASDDQGGGFTMVFSPALDYIAILNAPEEIENPVASDFAGLWKMYKGTDGNDGASAYVYIGYASDDAGSDFTTAFNPALEYIAVLTTPVAIPVPAVGDFTGLWKYYGGSAGSITHYCYIAWRDAPGDGFTLTPNMTLVFEAILFTHTELTTPVEADFVGCWRERMTPSTIHEVPGGGTAGQVLAKNSDDNYDASWQTPTGGGAPQLTAFPAIDKTASGITAHFTANEAQGFGDVVFLNALGKAQIGNATAIATATALAMLIDETVAVDAIGNYLLLGFVRNDTWGWTPGEWIYLSLAGTTENTLTQISPFTAEPIAEDTVVQMLGVANSATSFYFNPQLVQVELKP